MGVNGPISQWLCAMRAPLRNLPVQDRCQDQRAEANEISRDNGIRKGYPFRFVGGIEQQMVLLHYQWRTELER